jgi:bile acid-coenzyme A ligase
MALVTKGGDGPRPSGNEPASAQQHPGGPGSESEVDKALRAASRAWPAAEAIITNPGQPGGTLTWADLDRQTAGLAAWLEEAIRACGAGSWAIEAGTGKAGPSLLLLIAALRTDIPVVLLDESASGEERQAARDELHRAGLSMLVASAETDRGAQPEVHHAPGRGVNPPPEPLPRHAIILASGGTTGRIKLIVDTALRQPTSPVMRLSITSQLNWSADQTQLVIGRLHHAAPLTFFLRGLIDGNRLLVPERFAPSIAVRIIAEQRVHWLQATPLQLQRMAAWLQRHPADTGSLRGVLHMSAPCPPPVKRFWIDRIGPDWVFEIYGATEGIGMTVASGGEWLARPGTVGKGFFTQLRILDETMTPLSPGRSGLIFLRSLAASPSRYLREAGGLRISPDGFRSLGDHGRLDEQGYLYLEPRRVDMMNVAGENVYPSEVEAVLTRCPGIADAAVTGVADDRLGTRPVAFITCWPEAQLSERDIIEFCRQHLSRFKLPKRVLVVDEIPYTSAGKIDRRKLPGLLQERVLGSVEA